MKATCYLIIPLLAAILPACIDSAEAENGFRPWTRPEKLDDIPILLVHGSADDRVTYEEAETVAHKLDGLDRDFQFITVEGGGHSLRGTSYKRNVKSWLDKYLRNDLEFEETERRISIP